jgi:hypothetical protein
MDCVPMLNRRTFLLAVPVVAVLAPRLARAGVDPYRELRELIRCDACGASALTICRDVYEVEPVNGCESRVCGELLKAGCAAHPVESIFYDRSGAIDREAKESSDRFNAEVEARWERERRGK